MPQEPDLSAELEELLDELEPQVGEEQARELVRIHLPFVLRQLQHGGSIRVTAEYLAGQVNARWAC